MDTDIQAAYQNVIRLSRIQPADDQITILKKLLAQSAIDQGAKDDYIRGLEQLVDDLKKRISELEEMIEDK